MSQILTCPVCKTLFYHEIANRVVLNVILPPDTKTVIYCKRECMEAEVANVNHDKSELPIILVSREQIGINPETWLMVYKLDLKVNIL